MPSPRKLPQRSFVSSSAGSVEVVRTKSTTSGSRDAATGAAGAGSNDNNSDTNSGDGSNVKMPDQEMETKLAKVQTAITRLYQQGDYREALKQSQSLLRQVEQHFGRQHPATASAYSNCGLFYKLMGDFIPARKNYSQAQRIYGKVVGRDHASYALTLHNLGALNQSQVHFDTTLKATERLALVEKALEYFQEALDVRTAELGETHPHTIATRSAYGSTLAAQVLHQHKLVQDNDAANHKQASAAERRYVSLNPEALTQQAWDAAEVHLRGALETAIANPRGQSIRKQPRKGAKQKSTKFAKQPDIHTLSAASAGQHLAIFLKSRAMTSDPHDRAKLDESKKLYDKVLAVRNKLLPQGHPDLYATQYSMAELLEVIGDTEAANAIRQQILDTYHPEESSAEEEDQQASSMPEVVVEKTPGGSAGSSS